jgi:hypothetical protein
MKLIDFNWNPTDRQLKQFGVACFIALPLLGWLWTSNPLEIGGGAVPPLMWGLAGLGLVLAVVSLIKPQAIKPLFIAVSLVAFPIGLIVGELMLLLMFMLIFTPMALIFRLVGRDALQRKIDRRAKSYWQPKAQAHDSRSYYRQF